VPQLRRLLAGFPSLRPEFNPRLIHVGFVVDRMALRQVFSEHFVFPYQFLFHKLLHGMDGYVIFLSISLIFTKYETV
jgi:hypothetical protein